MLKTSESFEKLALRMFRVGNNEVVRGGGSRADEMVVDLSKFKNKKSRKSTHVSNVGATGEPNFLTPDAKKAFNHLRLAFIKASILRHFDPECHI